MKTLIKSVILIFTVALFTSCDSDDDVNIQPTGESKLFTLNSVANPSISGTARFVENSDNSTTIELQLTGTPDGGQHPAHIHFNTAAEGGDIALTLGTVNGDTGFSTVTTSTLNDGTSITYDQLLQFDGYINVHLSANELETLVAQGDIGQNELTATTKVYALGEVDVDGISGTATFTERVNGEVLATLALQNTPDGGMHPAHIHDNTALEGGDIAYTFNAVNGTTGTSSTNFDDISFENILAYDGYINVHLSMDDLATLVAQGDIGQNELTGESTTYALATVDVAGISGDVTFEERVNGDALATISLIGTPDGGMHPAHIHAGSVATAPGAIVFTFNQVDGTTGVSKTNVSALDDDSVFGYDEAVAVDGYVNVHLSMADLATLVAQGNVGANVN
ncbi:hypothetical protein Q2T40_12495 [Winogradskyella maritima]|uniref:CHRD domain-containing protein n=1 Tax=Winogradskyella maritima TaxID=1517766 RepID=A0ABV8AKK4_9FLAO|nr:hypothetical protein [Winogradskyella maritima]